MLNKVLKKRWFNSKIALGLVLSLWVIDAQAESKTCHAEAAAIPNLKLTDQSIQISEKEVLTMGGEPSQMTAHQGKVIVLNHWATWCAPCIHEMPTLTSLSKKTENMPAIVIGLSMDRSGYRKVNEFVERQGWNHATFLSDKKMQIGREYQVRNLPMTQIFTKEGTEFARFTGPYEWDKPEVVNLVKCLANS